MWCSVLECSCLQWWSLQMEGRESDADASQYVHTPPSPKIGSLFFRVFLFVSFSLLCQHWFCFWTMLSPLFFSNYFYHWTFAAQCFVKRMPLMVISPPGRSGKWRPWDTVRTLFPPLSTSAGIFFGYITNSILSTHFYHRTILLLLIMYGVVFLDAGAFNGDLSAWDVGEVTHMGIST